MGKGWFLRIIIFALLWIVGSWFFVDFGGSVGTKGSFMFIGQTIIGSNLNTQGGDIILMIISFIITAAVYFLISMILTFILQKTFSRR